MPDIRPFRGLRYNTAKAGDLSTLVAPPYDIIYDEWRERLYERNPYNIIRLIKTKDEPGDNQTTTRYTRARDYIESWMNKGILALEEKPAVYVRSETYLDEGVERTRYGFVSLLRLEEFGNGVYPHERTLSAPKVDRMNLVKATRTNLSQVFGIYRDPKGDVRSVIMDVVKSEPEASIVDDQNITRRLWIVTDKAVITRLQSLMREKDIIIADGHHRYETALAYRALREPERQKRDEPFDFVSMYFSDADDPGMAIFPTHRKVGELPGFDPLVFIRKLGDEFNIVEHDDITIPGLLADIREDAERLNVFGIFTGGKSYSATYRSDASPKALDVDVLHDIIIERHLGITKEDIQQGQFLHFSKSPEHTCEDVAAGKSQIAFLMNAVTPDELFRVVLQGRRLPQKSTYFYPKTLSGMVMYRIDHESLG
jgi:uncharacterized protein (DUF1015 family)